MNSTKIIQASIRKAGMTQLKTFAAILSLLLSFTVTAHAEEAAVSTVDVVMATAIVERNPVDASSTFAADIGTIYCFSKLKVAVDETTITHTWYYKDTERAKIELKVKRARGWRTYSSKNIREHEVGEWKVEIADASGALIDSVTFTVVE